MIRPTLGKENTNNLFILWYVSVWTARMASSAGNVSAWTAHMASSAGNVSCMDCTHG